MDLIARIAPFFAIIAAGAVAGRIGLLGPRLGAWLSAYTFWVGFPALLIRWLGDAPPSLNNHGHDSCAFHGSCRERS